MLHLLAFYIFFYPVCRMDIQTLPILNYEFTAMRTYAFALVFRMRDLVFI
jgi:hypothetical protein